MNGEECRAVTDTHTHTHTHTDYCNPLAHAQRVNYGMREACAITNVDLKFWYKCVCTITLYKCMCQLIYTYNIFVLYILVNILHVQYYMFV